jgi:hypothetical protein
MIEYLHNCIRATAGRDEIVSARLTDDKGAYLTSGCNLMLFETDGKMIATIPGSYADGNWFFLLPGDLTAEHKGKRMYCICHQNTNLCFKQPIYFI